MSTSLLKPLFLSGGAGGPITAADITDPENIVTNARVVSAGAESSGRIIKLPYTSKKLSEMGDGGTASQLCVVSIGDSLGRRVIDGFAGTIVSAGLQDLVSKHCGIAGYALSSLKYKTQSGTITFPADANDSAYAAAVAIWDSANVWTMASGAEQRIGYFDSLTPVANVRASTVSIYFVKQAGGGTATIDYSVDGGSNWTNLGTADTGISVSGAAGDPLVFTSSAAGLAGKPLILRIVASVGPVKHCGAKMVDTAQNGIIWAGMKMDSAALVDMNTGLDAVRAAILSDLSPSLVIAHMWENEAATQPVISEFVSNWTTAASAADMLIIEQYPSSSTDAVAPTINSRWKTAIGLYPKALSISPEAIVGGVAELDALGWRSDTIHLSQQVWDIVAGRIFTDVFVTANQSASVVKTLQNSTDARYLVGDPNRNTGKNRTFALWKENAVNGSIGVISDRSNSASPSYFYWTHVGTTDSYIPDGLKLSIQSQFAYAESTVDSKACWYFGPYNAATKQAYNEGARVVSVSEWASKNSILATTTQATPTAALIEAKNSASTSKFQVWDTGLVVQSPPSSATPPANGNLVIEATSNTTLTFKLKGSDGTVRTGTITLV